MNYRVFDTAEIDHQQIYRLLIGSVVPRPIAWVSTMSADGVANLAPFSFFTMVSHHPPMASISVGERENKPKDTARNILDTKGYVIHTVVNGWEESMNVCAGNYAPDESEFDAAGLEMVPADLVDAPHQGRPRGDGVPLRAHDSLWQGVGDAPHYRRGAALARARGFDDDHRGGKTTSTRRSSSPWAGWAAPDTAAHRTSSRCRPPTSSPTGSTPTTPRRTTFSP